MHLPELLSMLKCEKNPKLEKFFSLIEIEIICVNYVMRSRFELRSISSTLQIESEQID